MHYYFEDLYTWKYAEGSSVADHIAAMLDIKHCIEQASETIPDLYIAHAMILSLPKTQSWDIIKITFFELQSLTTEIVSTKLQQEANCHLCDKLSGETALFAHQSNSNRLSKGQTPGKRQNGREGCSSGNSNHKNHSRRGRSPKPDDKCHNCGKLGHWVPKCLHCEANEKKKGSANLTVANLCDMGAHEIGQVFMATRASGNSMGIILNCGATSHMFANADYFTKYEPLPLDVEETISVGDGCELPIKGYSSVSLKCRLPDGY